MMRRVAATAIALASALYISVEMQTIRRFNAPASDWLEVTSVNVFTAFEGEAPRMAVVRTIHQPFVADWAAVVRRVHPDGSTAIVCEAHGRSPYEPGASPLRLIDLDWWMTPVKCRPPAGGRYRLSTAWRIHVEGSPEKVQRAESNLFDVNAPPKFSP